MCVNMYNVYIGNLIVDHQMLIKVKVYTDFYLQI